jgi:hypothetical protein
LFAVVSVYAESPGKDAEKVNIPAVVHDDAESKDSSASSEQSTAQTDAEKKLEELEKQLEELKAKVRQGGQAEVEELDKLEKEIQELREVVEALASGKLVVGGLTDAHKVIMKEKAGAANHVNYQADWHLGTPEKYVPDQGWIGIKGATSEIKLWGWVQAATYRSFNKNLLTSSQEFSSGLIATPTVDEGTTGFDAGSTRLIFQSRHLVKGNVIQTIFLMDGGGADVGGGMTPRFRQFYASVNNLTFGLAGGTFTNGSSWPAYFDRGAPGAYPLARLPVVRYAIPLSKDKKRHILTVGAEKPASNITNANANFKWPNFVGRYDYNPTWGNLMAAFITRDLLAESTTDSGRAEKWSFGGTFTGYWTLRDKVKDHLKWNVVFGPAVSGYMWDSGFEANDGVYVDETQSLELMDAWGVWVGYDHMWSENMGSLFMYSYADIDNIADQADSAFNSTNTITATWRWSPWEGFWFGTEYMYGERKNLNGDTGFDNRLNFVFRYFFNK